MRNKLHRWGWQRQKQKKNCPENTPRVSISFRCCCCFVSREWVVIRLLFFLFNFFCLFLYPLMNFVCPSIQPERQGLEIIPKSYNNHWLCTQKMWKIEKSIRCIFQSVDGGTGMALRNWKKKNKIRKKFGPKIKRKKKERNMLKANMKRNACHSIKVSCLITLK